MLSAQITERFCTVGYSRWLIQMINTSLVANAYGAIAVAAQAASAVPPRHN